MVRAPVRFTVALKLARGTGDQMPVWWVSCCAGALVQPESTDRMSGSIELIYLIGGW